MDQNYDFAYIVDSVWYGDSSITYDEHVTGVFGNTSHGSHKVSKTSKK
jgi:hypothetical protein